MFHDLFLKGFTFMLEYFFRKKFEQIFQFNTIIKLLSKFYIQANFITFLALLFCLSIIPAMYWHYQYLAWHIINF